MLVFNTLTSFCFAAKLCVDGSFLHLYSSILNVNIKAHKSANRCFNIADKCFSCFWQNLRGSIAPMGAATTRYVIIN